jgi:hypothetical protein
MTPKAGLVGLLLLVIGLSVGGAFGWALYEIKFWKDIVTREEIVKKVMDELHFDSVKRAREEGWEECQKTRRAAR